jgi:hypothetical protein
MVVRFTATCVMNANPKVRKSKGLNISQILLRSSLTEGRRTLDLIINTVFRNCIKKSYETTGRMIPSRTNTPPAEESTR